MQTPLKIASRNLVLPAPLEDEIRERVDQLEQFFDRILGCRVTVEGPGGHHRQGRTHVRVDVKVPRAEIVVSRQFSDDVALALRGAFDAAARKLEDYVRRVRGDVKRPEALPQGRVTKLFRQDGYGFLEAEGREIYFHRRSVLSPGFGRLRVGTRVRFAEETGENGPQASSVAIVGKSH